MASPTQWTWVWVNSRRWWRAGKPGVLQSTGSQRVGPDLVTKHTFENVISWNCLSGGKQTLSFTQSSLLNLHLTTQNNKSCLGETFPLGAGCSGTQEAEALAVSKDGLMSSPGRSPGGCGLRAPEGLRRWVLPPCMWCGNQRWGVHMSEVNPSVTP